MAVLIGADQLTKLYFTRALESGKKQIDVIPNFFYFTYVLNDGAAYGILQGKRTLFLVTTPIAVAVFIGVYVYAYKKGYKTLLVALALIICGAAGNFIDRAFMASVGYAVTDFICIEIAGNRIFGVFNVADVELSAGVVLVVVHLLFLDKNAIFKNSEKESAENKSENGINDSDKEQNNNDDSERESVACIEDKSFACDEGENFACDARESVTHDEGENRGEQAKGRDADAVTGEKAVSDSKDKSGTKDD